MTTGESTHRHEHEAGATAMDRDETEQRSRSGAGDSLMGSAGTPSTGWDRVRWGPVWAGAIVALTTYLVLQLLFFAVGWLTLGFEGAEAGMAASVMSGVLALIAFFLGAVAASACTMWRDTADGIVNGLMIWGLSVVGILALGVFGGTALLGPLSEFAAQMPGVQPGAVEVDPQQVLGLARETAGWAALGLGLTAAAAALGGLTGAKLWPRRTAGAR